MPNKNLKKSLPDRLGVPRLGKTRTGGKVADRVHKAAANREERRVARSSAVRKAAKTGDSAKVRKAVEGQRRAYGSTTYSAPGRALRESGSNSSRSAAQRVRRAMG
jgi:hypothetical protein